MNLDRDSDRKRILFVQPHLNEPGGGLMVAVTMLEALLERHEVTLLTCVPFSFRRVDRFCGSSLSAANLEVKTLPVFVRAFFDRFPNDPTHFLRTCLLMRWARWIGTSYDLVMTAHNEMDFGRRGIQYVHHPTRQRDWRAERQACGDSARPRRSLRCRLERSRTWRLVSGFSFEGMKRNETLVNSRWTARWFEEIYGVKSRVVYPPVRSDFPEVGWEDKEQGFVCVGRIRREKRIEESLEILLEVRRQGVELPLRILGSRQDLDAVYYREIRAKVRQHAEWVTLEEDVSRRELTEILSRHRYGIHGMEREHFGIAVAEMVVAGCIPFVPNDGGQVEIVGESPELIYRSRADAVRKILDVVWNEAEQRRIRAALGSRRAGLGKETFLREFRAVVSGFDADGPGRRAH